MTTVLWCWRLIGGLNRNRSSRYGGCCRGDRLCHPEPACLSQQVSSGERKGCTGEALRKSLTTVEVLHACWLNSVGTGNVSIWGGAGSKGLVGGHTGKLRNSYKLEEIPKLLVSAWTMKTLSDILGYKEILLHCAFRTITHLPKKNRQRTQSGITSLSLVLLCENLPSRTYKLLSFSYLCGYLGSH